MLYRIDPEAEKTRIYTEPYSLCRLPYHTAKEMRERYPDGNFVIIGEIGVFARSATAGDRLVTDEEKTIPILPRGSFERPFEWIAGYIPVEKNTYIAAVKSLIPSCLWRRRGDPEILGFRKGSRCDRERKLLK